MTIPRPDDLADHGPPIHAQSKLVEKPAWAAFCWTDETSLWLELPCPVGKAPVVVQFPKSEAGYAKAMNLVEQCANIRREAPPPGWFKHIETTKVVREAKTTRPKGQAANLKDQSQDLQNSLDKILKKRGWL